MEIYPGDIYLNGTIWLSQRMVMENLNVSEGYLRKAARYRYRKGVKEKGTKGTSTDLLVQGKMPETGKAWRYSIHNGRIYYDYYTIPDRLPNFLRSQLGGINEIEEEYKQSQHKERLHTRVQIIAAIEKKVKEYTNNHDTIYYMYESEVKFPAEIAAELTKSMAWMRFLADYYDNNHYKSLNLNKKEDFLSICAEILAKKPLEGLRINTTDSLYHKLYDYPRNGVNEQRNYIVSGKHGNSNARKVGKMKIVHPETGELMPFDVHEAMIYKLWMNPFKSNKRTKYDLYNNEYLPELQGKGIDPISFRTFTSYSNRFDNRALMSKERDGGKHFNDEYMPYVPAFAVQMGLSLVVADGSGSKLAYQFKNKAGETCKKTLYMVRVSDVASRKIIGYSIGTHETPELVREAFKNAIKTTGRREFCELITDNGSGFTSSESAQMLNMISKKWRTITPGNSQENPAETYVRLLTEFSRDNDEWVYSGFNAHNINYKSNPDYFPENKDLPSRDEAYLKLMNLVDKWNATEWQGRSPNDRFSENMNPQAEMLSDKVLRFCFGERSETDLSYQRSFIKLSRGNELNRKYYWYTIPNYDENISFLTKETGYQGNLPVIVCFDEDHADIYTKNCKYLMTCKRTDKASKTSAEATPETDLALGHHKNRKLTFVDKADEFRDKVVESADVFQYGLVVKDGSKVKDKYNESMEEKLFAEMDSARSATGKKSIKKQKEEGTIEDRALNAL